MMNDSKKAKQMMKSSKMVAISLLESVAALAFLCAKYTRRASRKIVGKSNHKKMIGRKKEFGEESFGEGGLWRRSILMGDKCEPLNFSGVIYYDVNGNKLSEPPIKSPRASPFVPGYG